MEVGEERRVGNKAKVDVIEWKSLNVLDIFHSKFNPILSTIDIELT